MKRSIKDIFTLIFILLIPIIFIYVLPIIFNILPPQFPFNLVLGYSTGFLFIAFLKIRKMKKKNEIKWGFYLNEKQKARVIIGLACFLLFFGMFITSLTSRFGPQPIILIISFGLIFSSFPLIFLGGIIAEMGNKYSSVFNNFKVYIGLMTVFFSLGIILVIWSLSFLFIRIEASVSILYMAFVCFFVNFMVFYARKKYLKNQITNPPD